MQQAKKGQWVQIHSIVLKPEERATTIPEDTKKTPMQLWNKGYITHDAVIGDEVTVTTSIGRTEKGTLIAIEPGYAHDFGSYVPEIDQMRNQMKKELGV